jgi:LPPG:FO 2-phospho-L-lactate transferase
MNASRPGCVVYLSGGVGGARFAHGLARVLPPERLTLIVNTGDDFSHWGLAISPDLDTVMYSLADLADVARGWGLSGETFEALAGVVRYGGESWFQLGDRDLATHLMRTQWLGAGQTLTEVTARLCRGLGVQAQILPMSDQPCQTMIDTEQAGTLMFQHWLVQQRAQPAVRRVWFRGEPQASSAVLAALEAAEYAIIGPSNPYVSIDPILALPGVRERLAALRVVAVSPIVHGQAIKGPLATMLQTLAGVTPSARSIVHHYAPLLAAMVVERGDEAGITELPVLATSTIMHTRDDSRTLAQHVLQFARELGIST